MRHMMPGSVGVFGGLENIYSSVIVKLHSEFRTSDPSVPVVKSKLQKFKFRPRFLLGNRNTLCQTIIYQFTSKDQQRCLSFEEYFSQLLTITKEPFKCYGMLFSWTYDTHPSPRNANNVEQKPLQRFFWESWHPTNHCGTCSSWMAPNTCSKVVCDIFSVIHKLSLITQWNNQVGVGQPPWTIFPAVYPL